MTDIKKNLTDVATNIKKTKKVTTEQQLYLANDGLIDNVGSVFKLCNLASKRAVELNAGMPKLVDIKPSKLATVALEEIKQNKVRWIATEPLDE